jgi:hypothetical protein
VFTADTTTLTTQGTKTFQELENTPFQAILNGNIFSSYGTQYEGLKDFYTLFNVSAHKLLVTLDQFLVTGEGVPKNVQDFKFREPIRLISNPPTPYEGREEDIAYFRQQYLDQGRHGDSGIITIPINLDIPIHERQNTLLRLGIKSHLLRNFTKDYAILQIRKESVDNFLALINNTPIEITPPDALSKFRIIEYYDTLPAYSVIVNGAHAIDANCFYVPDDS